MSAVEIDQSVLPEQLARQAQAGCSDSLQALLSRYETRLRSYLRKRIRSDHDVDDLQQETLLRVCRGLEGYDAGRPFEHWLFTIAGNVAIDHLRKGRRSEAMQAGLDGTVIEQHDGDAANPPDTAETREEATRLWRIAADALSKRQFEMLKLRYRESFDIKQIAQRMKLSRIQVRVGLHRARKRLLALSEGKEM